MRLGPRRCFARGEQGMKMFRQCLVCSTKHCLKKQKRAAAGTGQRYAGTIKS